LGPLERANLNHWTIFPGDEHSIPLPSPETDPVSETFYFLIFRTPDDGQSPEIYYIHGRCQDIFGWRDIKFAYV
jgi:hypothetical protein